MPKLSEIAAVVEDHSGPYTLIDIHASRQLIICTIEHVGPEDLSAQAKFALGLVQLATAEDWPALVRAQTEQSAADLDRFLQRPVSVEASDRSP